MLAFTFRSYFVNLPLMQGVFFGSDGFLGTRASFLLDVVALAMIGVLAVLGLSIYLVRYRARYALHKRIQLALASALLVVVGLFEAEMRLHGWRQRAEPSPYYETWVMPSLLVHLAFSVSTCLLWTAVIVAALRKFDRQAYPGPHSASHRFWGRLAALDMLCTAVSGWAFYWLAFVARA
jgi:putative membrane protein